MPHDHTLTLAWQNGRSDGHQSGDSLSAYAPAGPHVAPPAGHTWNSLMGIALAEARQAAELGDCPIGALIINRRGQIMARAFNRVEAWSNPVAHAEMLAIMQACQGLSSPRLSGCILLVTLEPCLMCAGAIAHSRLDGVVFGAADQRAGAIVSAADAIDLPLAGRTFWHMGGIRSQECLLELQKFFLKRRSRS